MMADNVFNILKLLLSHLSISIKENITNTANKSGMSAPSIVMEEQQTQTGANKEDKQEQPRILRASLCLL